MLTLSEWRQKVLDNSKSCKAECHCTSEGSCTSCHEESMADVRCNECKQIMNADDSSGDSFILNTNALPRELQVQCLAETIIMMESHVGDSYKGKKFNNKKDISKNNSSGTVRPVGESDGAKSLIVDDCDECVLLDGFKWHLWLCLKTLPSLYLKGINIYCAYSAFSPWILQIKNYALP